MDLKFSLKHLHDFEDDLKGLLESVRVKDVIDISKSTLKSFTREPLIEHTEKLAKLLKFSHELLRNAAADLDSLKCEQLQNKSRLIQVQEELNVEKSVQLDSVQKTVDDKLSTWSSVVAKNSQKSVTQKEIKKAVKMAINEQDRERNVIMFNVPERDINDKNEHYDGQLSYDIMQRAGLPEQDGQYVCKRIGASESNGNKTRPLKISFSSKCTAFELLALSKKLKDEDKFSNVFITPDRTREEKVEHKKLVEQLRVKRTAYPGKNFYIWNKGIRSSN